MIIIIMIGPIASIDYNESRQELITVGHDGYVNLYSLQHSSKETILSTSSIEAAATMTIAPSSDDAMTVETIAGETGTIVAATVEEHQQEQPQEIEQQQQQQQQQIVIVQEEEEEQSSSEQMMIH
jgi:thymidine kinase